MGFVALQSPDGSVCVLRAHHDRVLGIDELIERRRKADPDWSMVRGLEETTPR